MDRMNDFQKKSRSLIQIISLKSTNFMEFLFKLENVCLCGIMEEHFAPYDLNSKWTFHSAFLTSQNDLKRLSHSPIHTLMAPHQEQFGIQRLAKGHFVTLTGGEVNGRSFQERRRPAPSTE